ncbi:MAG: hypothetical protein ABWZ18_08685 [Solirubrobacterales bacterium]
MDEQPIVPGHRNADLRDVEAARVSAIGEGREPSQGRLSELKREIELQRYAVDSAAVADAILSKLRLVKQGREALSGDPADRSPAAVARLRAR